MVFRLRPRRAGTVKAYNMHMSSNELTGRELATVQLVARFHQISSKQLRSLLFTTLASPTPSDRVLKKLTDNKYLNRIEHRLVGGARGGSGQFAYAIGPAGHRVMGLDGQYRPARTVSYHSLAVADAYIALRQLEAAGVLSLVGYLTEPDCWVLADGYELKPDLYVEFVWRQLTHRRRLEVDMGTEGQRHVKAKLLTYIRVWEQSEGKFPRVIWIAPDETRKNELLWWIADLPESDRALFTVTTKTEFPSLFIPQ